MAEAFRNFWRKLPPVQYAEHQYGMSPAEKLESDLLLLAGSMMTPDDIEFLRSGHMRPRPLHRGHRGFQEIKSARWPRCFLNAYRIDTKKIVEFQGPEIDIRHFRAAFSFPYLYAPYEIDGSLILRSRRVHRLEFDSNWLWTMSCLNIQYVPEPDDNAWRFIVFDVLGSDVIHPARNLMDAYGQSIILPIVGNAEKEISIFKEWVKTGRHGFYPARRADVQGHGRGRSGESGRQRRGAQASVSCS